MATAARATPLARRATALLLAGLAAPWGLLSAAPPDRESGFPLIQVHAPGLPEAESQHFGVARDPRGVLYFANVAGVLVHDGAWWRLIPVGRARSAFSLACDRAGRVGVGGVDEIGYLAPDAAGTLRYRSLVPLLPPAQRALGQVMQTLEVPGGFLFSTQKWLLRWDGTRVTTVASFPGDWPYAAIFGVGEEAYVWWRESGLLRLDGARLVPVPGGAAFRDRRIDALLPADPGLLVSIRGEGLLRWAGGAAPPVPFAPEASRWTAAKRILAEAAVRLDDGRWALGSVLGGLLLLRPDGRVDQVIDTAVGLPDDFVNGVTVDGEGALWLALNNGIARIEVASPVSVVDARSGLPGSVYSLARHRGRLWAGTAAGTFTAADGPGSPLRLRPVPGLPPAGWSLLSAGDELLVGTAFGLFEVGGDGVTVSQVAGIEQQTVYALVRSRTDPGRVWAGTEDGVLALRRGAAGWRLEARVAGPLREVHTLTEGRDGVLWCGTLLDGLIGLELPARAPAAGAELAPRRTHRLAGPRQVYAYEIGGRILALVDGRVLRLDEARPALVEDPALAPLAAEGRLSLLVEDAAGNLWRNTRPLTVARRAEIGASGAGWQPPQTVAELPPQGVELILPEPDGVVWLASEKGLFRYVTGFPGSPVAGGPLPTPLLGRVTAGRTLLFGGAPTARPAFAELPADTRRLRLELAPLTHRAGLRYQTRLEPLDAAWGDPAAEPFAELTRLPAERYTFRARTVGPQGELSPEAAWSFRVLPHWYETPWALGLAALLLAAAVLGAVHLRSRALRLRAARLEERVAAQTVDLQRTVAELRRAQADLETANVRLEELARRDDLTGIANRRRLQQQLRQDWQCALAERRPLAFVLVDIDHFKRLNDTRGHSEGDLCLQAVARYLDDAVRQQAGPEALVARYGGEEFAVLLPGVGLAAAEELSERLRHGIEALALPHDGAPSGRITASFGVAAWIPEEHEFPEALIEDADLALYRAKNEGRNRVCAAAA